MIAPLKVSITDAEDLHTGFGSISKYCKAYGDIWQRKFWEYLYVSKQFNAWVNKPVTCLGYGCGRERVPFFLIEHPLVKLVMITDLATGLDRWTSTRQWSNSLDWYYQMASELEIVGTDKLAFLPEDMNNINTNLSADFIWSCSSLEHLGTMDHAKNFIINSSKCLKPGGLAVHCTEYNFNNEATCLSGDSVFFREQEIWELKKLCDQNDLVLGPIDLRQSNHPFNILIDKPPYEQSIHHLKVAFDSYIITSLGLCIWRKE